MSAIWINPLLLATWTRKISSDLTTRRKARQVWGLPFQKEVTSSNQSMRFYRNLRKTEQSISLLKKDRKSTRLNSSHVSISYAVFCLKKKKYENQQDNYKINKT